MYFFSLVCSFILLFFLLFILLPQLPPCGVGLIHSAVSSLLIS